MNSPVSAIEAIERFERAVRANGYRTSDDQTEAEYRAAKAAVIALARQAEALERENAELREGLKPFADAAQLYDPPEGDDGDVAWAHDFTIGSLRRARALLGGDNAGN